MDQGEIYEEGTPEQIFEHPQKELTRRFVRHLKVLEREIRSDSFDFPGFSTEMETFGRRHIMPQLAINSAQVILEELVVQTMLNGERPYDKLNFVLEYSESGESIIQISWEGDNRNPMESMDPLSLVLVDNSADEIRYEQDGTGSLLNIRLRTRK